MSLPRHDAALGGIQGANSRRIWQLMRKKWKT